MLFHSSLLSFAMLAVEPVRAPVASVLVLNGHLTSELAFAKALAEAHPCVLLRDWGDSQSPEVREERIKDILTKIADPRERLSQGIRATVGCSSSFDVDIRYVWDARTMTLWAAAGSTLTRRPLPPYVKDLANGTVRGQFLVEALKGAISSVNPISPCPDNGCTLFHRFWVNNILSRDLLDRLGKLANESKRSVEDTSRRISHARSVISAYLDPESNVPLEIHRRSALGRCEKTELRYSAVEPNRPWTIQCTRGKDVLPIWVNTEPLGVLTVVEEEIPAKCDDVKVILQDPDSAIQIAPGVVVVYSSSVVQPLEMSSLKCQTRVERELREWEQTDFGQQIDVSWVETGDPTKKPPPTIACVHESDLRKLYSVSIESLYTARVGYGVTRLKVRIEIIRRYEEQSGFSLSVGHNKCKVKNEQTVECDTPAEFLGVGAEWAMRQVRMSIPLALCEGTRAANNPSVIEGR